MCITDNGNDNNNKNYRDNDAVDDNSNDIIITITTTAIIIIMTVITTRLTKTIQNIALKLNNLHLPHFISSSIVFRRHDSTGTTPSFSTAILRSA